MALLLKIAKLPLAILFPPFGFSMGQTKRTSEKEAVFSLWSADE
jgi:hypothetical protein